MKGARILLLALLCLSAPLSAQEEQDKLRALIDAVVSAYGGDALVNLSNVEIIESYISPNTGQSWHPDLTDIGRFNFRLVHDLEGGNLYAESWFNSRTGQFPNLVIVNGDGAFTVNLLSGRVGSANSDDPYVVAGGIMRTTDTLLALELHRARDQATYLGETRWMNRAYERIKMPFPQSPDLTLYIDPATGLIKRMTRENPQLGSLDYVFNEHVRVDGILAAKSVNFSVAGDPNLLGTRREIRFNQSLAPTTFTLPTDLEEEGERIDASQMVVNRLSGNVYHIGQNTGFSIFVDTGSEVIGCGGYPGLTDRLAKFREETGNFRPLRYQVVTHHHQDHLGGIDEALSLGATLITVDFTVPVIRENSRLEPGDGRFLTVNERMTLGEGSGRVEIYDVSTNHSASNLLFYVPSVEALFMADHFGGPFAEGVPVANTNTVSMAEALEPLDLDISRVVTAHNARVYTGRDFKASVRAYRDYDCPGDRPLCSR